MAGLVEAEEVIQWTRSEDPEADAILVVGESRLHVRRAILDLCSPVFKALPPGDSEIPIIGFTVEQVDLFLKFVHPSLHWKVTIDAESILQAAPVAHFYDVQPMLEHFVAHLQNDDAWLKHANGIAAAKSMDAIVLIERLRKRTEGEACPWKEEILKKINQINQLQLNQIQIS